MTDAFIYDAVRTPRGKGKKDGALHQVTPVHLIANVLWALRELTGQDRGDASASWYRALLEDWMPPDR